MDCDAIRDDMLDVIYGEGGEAAARRVEAHHAVCAACRDEMAGLRRVRGHLGQWRMPEALRASPPPASSRRWPVALAAAAGLILALTGALALARAEIRYDHEGLSVRFGEDARRDVVAAQRDREAIAALRAEVAALRSRDAGPSLAAVESMIRESEGRQAEARQASLREIRERTDTQRQYDLARVSAGLAYLDGKAGLQAARTTELMGHLLQASQQK